MIRRADIRIVDLEPARPDEANERRPCIVVSNDGANGMATERGRGGITVVPLTSNVSRIYSFQVLLPAARTGLTRDSKAQAEQVRSVSVTRLGPLIGQVPSAEMRSIDDALRRHLAL